MSKTSDKASRSKPGQMSLEATVDNETEDVVKGSEPPVEVSRETDALPPVEGQPSDGDIAGSGGESNSPDQPAIEESADRQFAEETSEREAPVVDPSEKRADPQATDELSESEPIGSSNASELAVEVAPDTDADEQAAPQPSVDEPAEGDNALVESASGVRSDSELVDQSSENASEGHPHDADSQPEPLPEVAAEQRTKDVDDGDSLAEACPEAGTEQGAEIELQEPHEECEPPAEATPGPEGEGDARTELDGRIFYLTNRYNYLDNLSARLIRQGPAMQKYYQDLLSIRCGVVPLMNTGVSRGLVEYVEAEHPQAFPILLELDVEQIGHGVLPALSVDDEALSGTLTDAMAAYAPNGVIPMSVVRTAYFRSEEEKTDFLSRRAQYKNLDVESIDLRVDADLFEKMPFAIEVVESWLKGIGDVGKMSVNDVQMADRVAGGICLAAAAAPADERYVEMIADLIRGVKPSAAKLKDLPHWLVGGRLQTLKSEARRKMDVEEIVFDAVGRVILDTDPGERWRPREVLKQVVALVESTQLEDKDRDKFQTTAEYIRRVLLNEADLELFTPGRGISTAKALLIFLQRPEPNRVLQAESSYPGVTKGEMVTAAVYSGLLLGLAQIPAEFRANGIDDVLGNMEAWFLNQKASNPLVAGDRRLEKPTIETRLETDGRFVAGIDLGGLGHFEIHRRLSLLEIMRRVDPTPQALQWVVELVEALAAHFQTYEWVDEFLWSCIEGESEKAPKNLGLPAGTVTYRGSRAVRVVPNVELLLERLDRDGLPDEIDERFRGSFLKAQFPPVQPDRSRPQRGPTWAAPSASRS